MATCTGSMLSLPSTSYQPLRVRAATDKGRRSLCSLKGRSCSFGGVSFPELAWKAVNKELVAAATRCHHNVSVRKTYVCSATTSADEERPQEQASPVAVKFTEAGNVLLKLVREILFCVPLFCLSLSLSLSLGFAVNPVVAEGSGFSGSAMLLQESLAVQLNGYCF